MKKITFAQIAPHALAVFLFFVVTVFFFSPVFFDNKVLDQHDINEYLGTSKALRDYREATGNEGLWAAQVFSGMPAYLISIDWSDGGVAWFKKVAGLFLPHPVINIFWAFLSFYILLLVIKVRPYLAISGAIAFGLSSFMIIGLSAGHNGRIGAIAFMPLVLAGIWLVFNDKKLLGTAVTAIGMALHLRENHLQMTYYLAIICAIYVLVEFILAAKSKGFKIFTQSILIVALAVILGAGTFFGQFWSVSEYSKYSIRGKSELSGSVANEGSGLTKAYAFEYSNGIFEPLTLFVPNILGGGTSRPLIADDQSKTYQALVQSGDQEMANQYAPYLSSYWGEQSNTAPYYAGAIIVFLFVAGFFFADKKLIWWLLPVSVISIVMSWGDNFSTVNYFLFDYLPGFNKFRSVTFALVLILIAMPLLGMAGLEQLFKQGLGKPERRKLLIVFALTGGLAFLLWLTGGFGSFLKESEGQLPVWLTNAMKEDRSALLSSDALRSGIFISIFFLLIYFELHKKISAVLVYAALLVLMLIDLGSLDKRYFSEQNYRRKSDDAVQQTEADKRVLADKSYYRVYNLQNPLGEARTSYFHHSLGGYHGAKLRRYQDLFDSLVYPQTNQLIEDARSTGLKFSDYGVLNMLNAKYLTYGPGADNIILNPAANGPVWLIDKLEVVQSPSAELSALKDLDTRSTAVIDGSKFQVSTWTGSGDSLAQINLVAATQDKLEYESSTTAKGFAVFSEVYYPHGWKAFIDGKESEILRVNYVLRGLWIEPGKHRISFEFKPAAYYTGDKVTAGFNALLILFFAFAIFRSIKE